MNPPRSLFTRKRVIANLFFRVIDEHHRRVGVTTELPDVRPEYWPIEHGGFSRLVAGRWARPLRERLIAGKNHAAMLAESGKKVQ